MDQVTNGILGKWQGVTSLTVSGIAHLGEAGHHVVRLFKQRYGEAHVEKGWDSCQQPMSPCPLLLIWLPAEAKPLVLQNVTSGSSSAFSSFPEPLNFLQVGNRSQRLDGVRVTFLAWILPRWHLHPLRWDLVAPRATVYPWTRVTWGTSLVVQWVRLLTPNAGGLGWISGQGTRSRMHSATKSPHATTKKPTCRKEVPTCHDK